MQTIDTPAEAGRRIRELRREKRLSQEQLALRAGVSRKFVADFEAGHGRAELGKALRVMHAAGYNLIAEPRPDDQAEDDTQQIIDTAALTMRRELHRGDQEFALRILADTVTEITSRCTARPPTQLRKPASTRIKRWDKLIAAAIGYALRRAGAPTPEWTQTSPLAAAWYPYDRGNMTPAYKDLTTRETPPELAAAGIFLRERSLTSA